MYLKLVFILLIVKLVMIVRFFEFFTLVFDSSCFMLEDCYIQLYACVLTFIAILFLISSVVSMLIYCKSYWVSLEIFELISRNDFI